METVRSLLTLVHAHNRATDQARLAYRDRLAPDFNVFDFIGSDELSLSRALAWLLNPRGSHGQGDRFLRSYLALCDLPWSTDAACEKAFVRVEAQTDRILADRRRIDILITTPSWAVAIENKPFAADQRAQVADYFSHLATLAPQAHALVYLTGDGRDPTEGSLPNHQRELRKARGELVNQAWKVLPQWLETCRTLCRNDRVGWMIGDFKALIERTFMGVSDMDDTRHLAAEIARSKDHIVAAHQVYAAVSELRRQLVSTLLADLRSRAASRGWVFEEDLHERIQWGGVQFQFSAGDPFAFRCEFGTPHYDDVCFGLRVAKRMAFPGQGPRQDRILAALGATPLKQTGGERWLWRIDAREDDAILPVPRNWGSAPQVWADMADGTLATKIIDAATQVHDRLKAGGALLEPSSQPANAAVQ